MIKKVIKDSFIVDIFKKHVHFEGVATPEKFYAQFTSLYNIPIFKTGLDLILTRMKEDRLKFDVKLVNGWDTFAGCYLTEQQKVFNKVLNVFSDGFRHRITIKSLTAAVVAHEMAHALDVEGGFDLNEDFRKSVGFDMKGRKASNYALRGSIQRIMVEGVKTYPDYQIISELFARYFELLSICKDVQASGDFLTSDVMDFFANTTKWIDQVFNPKIKDKPDQEIVQHTAQLIRKNAFKQEKIFAHKVKSFYKKTDEKGRKTFAANVKHNAAWHKSWQQHQTALEGKANKNIEDKT